MSKYGVSPGPYFPIFGLNTEIYSVNLRIQFEYRKIWTRKTPYFDTFHAVIFLVELQCEIFIEEFFKICELSFSELMSTYFSKVAGSSKTTSRFLENFQS